MKTECVWKTYDEAALAELECLNQNYRSYISRCKTERECVKDAIVMAETKGYRNLVDVIAAGETLQPGDKVYANQMDKLLALYHIGNNPMEQGMNILGAHVDSPRLDVKFNPLYENHELAYLDTHYYGGIKKYQWVCLPMAIHGVVVKKDGTSVDVVIGEKDTDPVVGITELLIHLSADMMQKKASEVIHGEDLDVLVGSKPLAGEEKEQVKAGILAILKEKYDIEEADFLSAELEIVPAGPAREAGLDRSMIMGYGQDDRVCAYTSLEAILDLEETPERTAVCLLTDKEEVGSYGATGMHSAFFINMTAEVLDRMGVYSELTLKRTLQKSCMLSSDVSAAYDPLYAAASQESHAAFLGHGICFNKYTGSRGKSGSNDANAEYIAKIRKIMDDANVAFQFCELGKVDQGGGGTIAYILANYGMEVIDCGVAVLSMHAPWETTSKADIYEAKKAYVAFLRNCK